MDEILLVILILFFVADIILRIYQVGLPKSHLRALKREKYSRKSLQMISNSLKEDLGENSKAAAVIDDFLNDEEYSKNLDEAIAFGNKTLLQNKEIKDSELLKKLLDVLKK